MQSIGRRTSGLRRYQARVLHGLLRNTVAVAGRRARSQTVMFPRQAGKNQVSAAFVAALLTQHARRGGSVIVCAPTYTPQARISQERMEAALAAVRPVLPPGTRVNSEANMLRCGRAEAVFLSASPEANVAGHTASIALIADEAQDIDADWFDRQFRPMTASTGAPVIFFGTAWDGCSLLEREAARNRETDGRHEGEPYRDFVPRHHEVSWREVAATVPAYGRHVRFERERLGAGHPLFQTQYELTPARGAGALLGDDQLAALHGTHEVLRGPRPGERYVAGLDFGGEGERADATVLTIARVVGGRAEVVAIRRWQAHGFAALVDAVAGEVSRWRIERVSADATGMGAPLCAQIEPHIGPRLERVIFTAQSKSQLGFELLAAANTGSLALPIDDGSGELAACVAELRACRSSLVSGGLLRWFAPAGAHDDHVASLVLCLHAAGGLPAPRVARGRRGP
ncbi:MAG: hypothetical protein LC118_03750 [Dehalococcoidia bacterium]|nr:hypothetical protein [Dehalococcoidia bacterium]